MFFFAVDELVILVTFTCKQDDVAFLGHLDGGVDGLAAVGDAGVGRAEGHMGGNVVDDILRRLVVRVVAGDDAVIRIGTGCVGQFLAADLGAPAHRAEHTNQAVRIVGPQRL